MAPQLLPKPGEVVNQDFRLPLVAAEQSQERPIKLLQWNIERGYELDKVRKRQQHKPARLLICYLDHSP